MVRIKNRYFVLELVTDSEYDPCSPVQLSGAGLESAIRSALLNLHGLFGSALATISLEVTYCNALTRVALVRCLHVHQRLVGSALALISCVDDRQMALRTLYCGATLMHCYKFLKRHQERRLEQIWWKVPEQQRHALRGALMSLTLVNSQQSRHLAALARSQSGRLNR